MVKIQFGISEKNGKPCTSQSHSCGAGRVTIN